MAEFKDRVKKLRLEHNLTQDELAQELGISRSTIGMYETGKREADYETLESLADYFNVDMNYLIGWTDEPHDWEQIANEEGICPPNDYDGDPEDWFKMKIHASEDYEYEGAKLIKTFINDSHFEELASSYVLLNSSNKDKVTNYTEKLLDIQRLEEQSNVVQLPQSDKSYLEPVAAHERSDIEVTDEMRKNDDDIMNDDDFWK